MPQETWRRIRPIIGEFGITRVGDITGLDHIGIPVCIAVRPNSRTLSVTQGKGLDLWSARVSAVMEAIEVAHAEDARIRLKFSTYADLRGRVPVVQPATLPGVRNSLFGSNCEVFWTEARELEGDALVWVPYEMVHADATLPWMPGSGSFLASTNGLASGNLVNEAILHGVCEVIERDALALWEHGSFDNRALTRLDLDSIEVPSIKDLVDKFHSAGITPMAWNITSDIEVAAVRAVIFDDTADTITRPFPAAFGAGCHPDRVTAVIRALTEAAQSRLTVISGSRDDFGRARYQTTQSAESLDHHRRLARASSAASTFESIPTWVGQTVEEDLSHVMQCLRRIGIDSVLTVDLSRPHVPVAVVRVIIPGLEGPTEAPSYVPGPRARAIRSGLS